MQAAECDRSPSLLCSFSGSAEEVRHRLRAMDDGQVVAFSLEGLNEHEAKAFEQVVVQIMDLTEGSFASLSTTALSGLVEILLPKQSPGPALLIEAKMLWRAKMAVIQGAEWLTAAQVAAVAGLGQEDSISKVDEWKLDGAIFTIRLGGVDYFPGYALDPRNKYRPYRALRKVIAHFQCSDDGWSLAYWFQSVNSFLGGKRPVDLLGKYPRELIAAAYDAASREDHA